MIQATPKVSAKKATPKSSAKKATPKATPKSSAKKVNNKSRVECCSMCTSNTCFVNNHDEYDIMKPKLIHNILLQTPKATPKSSAKKTPKVSAKKATPKLSAKKVGNSPNAIRMQLDLIH